jgi:hypothetical protein
VRFPRLTPLGLGAASALLALLVLSPAAALAADEPAGGAATGEVVLATAGASVATAVLMWLIVTYRSGRNRLLAWAAETSSRIGGLPGWAALPAGIAGGALVIALLGMMWDISLHVDDGRDAGPLANPAHYLILIGLFGIFAAGCLAVALPKGERPGPAAVKITRDWYAPVGGILMAAAAGFALLGFPLDDMWHRLFGQDVTLWGPTHLMLIGGAGLTLIGQAILLAEGMYAKRAEGASRESERRQRAEPIETYLRRMALMGGLLIGLSTFQAEFDFGIPQFNALFHPILIAFAAGMGLVAARIWVGPGGALAAAVFFFVVRGAIAVIVGPVLGETFAAQPLYLVEALAVEAIALAIARRRPLALGAASGVAIGTLGFASEYGWTHAIFRQPWNESMLPEGVLVAVAAGVAGGLLGGLLGSGLRRELPAIAPARAAFAAGMVTIAALVGMGLVREDPSGMRAQVALTETAPAPNREVAATIRITPASAAEDARWVSVTAWQGGGKLVVDRLREIGPGVYRTTKAIPVYGEWKSVVRVHKGRELAGTPLFLPADEAIPAKEVPATASFTRPFTDEKEILQRELKDDVAGWLWVAASLIVLLVTLGFVAALAWGVARVSRTADGPTDGAAPAEPSPPRRREGAPPRVSPTPSGA